MGSRGGSSKFPASCMQRSRARIHLGYALENQRTRQRAPAEQCALHTLRDANRTVWVNHRRGGRCIRPDKQLLAENSQPFIFISS